MFRCFISLILLLEVCCFCELPLNFEERANLKEFVDTLISQCEGGYVIYGKKPICAEGYFLPDPLPVDSIAHKQSVAFREGARLWRNLANSNSDVVIHIGDREDQNIHGYIPILVINKPLFHSVINENLALFQYVLGQR